MLTAQPRTAPTSAGPGHPRPRLAWLDAIRGLGATAVLLEHMFYRFLPGLRPTWFHLGTYGVLVFFLVSGYIIPASLENGGDVRAFWVGRFFRLYPLYLLVIGLVLASLPLVPLREAVVPDAATAAAHATMLLDVVGSGGVADTMWTLSYEMVFYLLVTVLFVAGLHRRSGAWALAFAAVSLVVGLFLAAPVLARGPAAFVALAVFAAGLGCVVAGSGRVRQAGALLLGGLAVTLVLLGSRTPWLGPAIIAVMFAGTAIHRWERGRISARREDGQVSGHQQDAQVSGHQQDGQVSGQREGGKVSGRWGRGQMSGLRTVVAVALVLAVIPFFAFPSGVWAYPRVWITTLALAVATFAGGMALRRRAVPRVLVGLGVISYSVYLLHHPLLKLFLALFGDPRERPPVVQGLLAVAFLAAVLAVSGLTYRYVERPMQRAGRRLAQAWASPPPRDMSDSRA
ncbi:acyltransferase family protein [Sphaerisporangium perillae]|uniref:acyltransferase family protein n=1 Tax=Sphaerisporangium perillae TaxID=2935860 RepID=UPI00200E10BC|nr:acyltransferase [Sphaerisporangium perillae]